MPPANPGYASNPHKAAKRAPIIVLGSEGGKLVLAGILGDTGWKFRIETDESMLCDLGDAEEQTGSTQRPWVATWRSALKQLDAYPWTELHPLAVHPEFHTRVLRALQARRNRGATVDWRQWKSLPDQEDRF